MKKVISVFLMAFAISLLFTSGVLAVEYDLNKDVDYNSVEVQKELKQEEEITKKAAQREYSDEELRESLEIIKKDNPEMYKKVIENNHITTNGQMGTMGAILLTYDSSTLWWEHGHAAIVREHPSKIVEAWKGDVKKVRIYNNNWGNRFNSKKRLYVKGTTESNVRSAQRYAASKVGKPYSITAGKNNTNKFYCSQLVWQAYNNIGFDIDGNGGAIVTPANIENSPNTVVY